MELFFCKSDIVQPISLRNLHLDQEIILKMIPEILNSGDWNRLTKYQIFYFCNTHLLINKFSPNFIKLLRC